MLGPTSVDVLRGSLKGSTLFACCPLEAAGSPHLLESCRTCISFEYAQPAVRAGGGSASTASMYVCMDVCTYVSMYVCMHVCMCVCVIVLFASLDGTRPHLRPKLDLDLALRSLAACDFLPAGPSHQASSVSGNILAVSSRLTLLDFSYDGFGPWSALCRYARQKLRRHV